jgi:hypothetical protein
MAEIWLIAREGPAAGAEMTVRDELVLGRGPGAAGHVIEDPGISREHVKVRVDGQTLVVEDLDSSNGTYVNGERISTATRLSVGDVLQLGSSALEVSLPGEETEVLASGPPTTAAAPPAPPRRAQPEPTPEPAQAADSGGFGWKAIAAAVLGPLSILLLVFGSGFLFYIALPVAVLAVALGSAGKRDADRGIGSRSAAVAGQVFGIIGTVLATVVVLVLIVVSVATDVASDNLSGLIDDVEAEIESEVDSRTP